jgi:hypothetical protein
LIYPLRVQEILTQILYEDLEGVLLTPELVFVYCDPVFDRGVSEGRQDCRDLSLGLSLVFGKEEPGVFFPFDEYGRRDLARPQRGGYFVGGVRCNDGNVEERRSHAGSHFLRLF